MSAGSRGLRAFLTGITDEERQDHRELLFPVDEAAVKAAAKQLRSELEEAKNLGRAVLGPKDSPQWKKTDDWNVIDVLQN